MRCMTPVVPSEVGAFDISRIAIVATIRANSCGTGRSAAARFRRSVLCSRDFASPVASLAHELLSPRLPNVSFARRAGVSLNSSWKRMRRAKRAGVESKVSRVERVTAPPSSNFRDLAPSKEPRTRGIVGSKPRAFVVTNYR